MKYLYENKHWALSEEYNIDKLLYLLIDRPNLIKNNGNFIWKNNIKQFHRDYDLPSFIYSYNEEYSLYWFVNEKFHRDDDNKPAYIEYNGVKEYYTYNKLIKTYEPK